MNSQGDNLTVSDLAAVIALVVKVFQKTTTCQSIREDEEAVTDDVEDDEEDQFLIDAACDCVIEMVKVFGVLMEPYLQVLCPPLFQLMVTSLLFKLIDNNRKAPMKCIDLMLLELMLN